jgi:hypothetical protein
VDRLPPVANGIIELELTKMLPFTAFEQVFSDP